jgi:hypothetical protein
MADENNEGYNTNIHVIDEGIKAVAKYLTAHPEGIAWLKEFRNAFQNSRSPRGRKARRLVGYDLASVEVVAFLGSSKSWYGVKVRDSFERLNLYASEDLDKEATESLKVEERAKHFVKAVKDIKPDKKAQRIAAEAIEESGDFSRLGIRGAVLDAKHKDRKVVGTAMAKTFEDFLVESRKDLLPSEMVAIAKQLRPQIEREFGGRGRRRDLETSANLAQVRGEKTRDIVANQLNTGHTTLQKAEEIIDSGDQELIEMMDRQGNIPM